MDRTDQSIKPSLSVPNSQKFVIESGQFSNSGSDTTCACFGPMHYEPGYAYPLIVWLHGQRDDERQLMRIMPMVSMRNYVAVAPRGTAVIDARPGESCGFGWNQSGTCAGLAEQRIFEAVENASRKFHISRKRVFLAGFDTGGTMAFRIAMNHPDRFAGILSLCGCFPHAGTPFGRLNAARDLPVFLAVCRDSKQFSPERACENLRLFHTAGVSVTLRQYPCEHELSPQMLADMDRWIIEQIHSPGVSAE